MQKKGQVVVFLVVGILILLIVGIILFLSSEETKEVIESEAIDTSLTQDIKPQIVSFVENCMKKQAIRGIEISAVQGGRIFLNYDSSFRTENSIISYSYLNGNALLSIGSAENDLAKFIDLTMDECTDYFSQFTKEGKTIVEAGSYDYDQKLLSFDLFDSLPLKSEVTISDKVILIETKYPLEIKNGDDEFNLDTFTARVPSHLGKSIKDALLISKQENYDLSFFSEFEPFIKVIPYDEENTIYSMYYDEESLPPVFMYVVGENE